MLEWLDILSIMHMSFRLHNLTHKEDLWIEIRSGFGLYVQREASIRHSVCVSMQVSKMSGYRGVRVNTDQELYIQDHEQSVKERSTP
jgi:hypothetical protein